MKGKNLIHEIIPAEKRLAKIDEIDEELERRWQAKEITLTEYFDAKRPLTLRRLKEFRLVARARQWDMSENIDVPEKVPIDSTAIADVPPPEIGHGDQKGAAMAQRWVGGFVFVVLVVAFVWIGCWLKK